MKDSHSLLFLGTCAADFSPRLETDLKDVFDREIRRASCALLDGRYMIDCGPHAIRALAIAGKKGADVDDLFFTHLHSDHFRVDAVASLAAQKKTPLNVWVREDADFPQIPGVVLHRMTLTKTYRVTETLSVTGLPANHDQRAFPQWLLFEIGGKRLLYALDGAWFVNDAYNYLTGKTLNALVLDCTVGDYIGDYRLAEHNSIPMIRLMLPSLKTTAIIDDATTVYVSHLAQTLHRGFDETVRAAGNDFRVAYDGLEISI